MILIDSSAWIEYLRRTGSPTHLEVRRLLHEQLGDVHMTEPVIMEILAGPTNISTPRRLEKLVDGMPLLPVHAQRDYRSAAAAARACRSTGHPVRSIVDCLIAAVAVRTGAALLHRDRDFEHLAACLPDLHLHPAPAG
jgi:predicted nucleic acid-binding protein